MFIIQCGKCGREQAWGMETEIGQAEIEVVNNSVMCTWTHGGGGETRAPRVRHQGRQGG